MTVALGRGYSPAEERGKLPVAEIPADAIFSPVRRVNYKIERARIGQVSNFDRLVMEVWTDGTISPSEALSTAAQLVVKHMAAIADLGDVMLEEEPEVEESRIPERIAETNIEDLDLTVRAFNCLKRAGITKVGEILEKLERDEEELLSIRNFGQKSLDELKLNLEAKGFWPLPVE
jgi:DNA-directed RNA polymerase subunit alpha